MLKAVREAKVHTSWINPDTRIRSGARALRQPSRSTSPLFLKDMNDAVAAHRAPGPAGRPSQALLKVASPGVPDYYQGTELLDFSLVDPDNRRPVDYALRA